MTSIPEAMYTDGRHITLMIPGGLVEESIAGLADATTSLTEEWVTGPNGRRLRRDRTVDAQAWQELGEGTRELAEDPDDLNAQNKATTAYEVLARDTLALIDVEIPTTDAMSLARQMFTEAVLHGTEVDERNALDHLDAMRAQFVELIAAKRARTPRTLMVLAGGEPR